MKKTGGSTMRTIKSVIREVLGADRMSQHAREKLENKLHTLLTKECTIIIQNAKRACAHAGRKTIRTADLSMTEAKQ